MIICGCAGRTVRLKTMRIMASKKRTIKLLDLCCKAGGCSVGYKRAADDLGFKIEITGIDIEPQLNYPFKFIQADAVEYLRTYGSNYSHIHASPPCQKYSTSTRYLQNRGKVYRDCLDEITRLMYATSLPGTIENVMPSPLRADVVLRGDMFGLKVIRKRKFECVNWECTQPPMPELVGSMKNGDYISIYGRASWKGSGTYHKERISVEPVWRKKTIRETWAYAMGIDWPMKDVELSEAIPPAYTHFIGLDFLMQ